MPLDQPLSAWRRFNDMCVCGQSKEELVAQHQAEDERLYRNRVGVVVDNDNGADARLGRRRILRAGSSDEVVFGSRDAAPEKHEYAPVSPS
jgi:hypothetical protein